MYRIAFADDNEPILKNFRDFFEDVEDIECVFTANSLSYLLSIFKRDMTLDFLFLDHHFPKETSIKIIPKLRTIRPETEIIMFTVAEDEDVIFKALSAGASGYLLKHTALPDIANFIRMTAEGGAIISPQIARKLIAYFRPNKDISVEHEGLSEKDTQILRLLSEGKSYKIVGHHLDLSLDAVRYHIKKIYKLLHVNNKIEAIKKYQDGL